MTSCAATSSTVVAMRVATRVVIGVAISVGVGGGVVGTTIVGVIIVVRTIAIITAVSKYCDPLPKDISRPSFHFPGCCG